MKKLFSEIPRIGSGHIEIKELTENDADALNELVRNDKVYKYLPTFLFERKYEDIHYVIKHLYDECFEESIILGIFAGGVFCGIAEMYGYRDELHKIITASTMTENHASANVLRKNGFDLVVHEASENWGFPLSVKVDKWIR